MKILICVDSFSWAIGQLAEKKVKYLPHFDIRMTCVHPRDAGDKNKQEEFKAIVDDFDPDIIHFEYFRTASQLLEAIPELKARRILLTHHNQKDKALGSYDWFGNGVDYISCFTSKCKDKLVNKFGQLEKRVRVIHHGIDLSEFTYSEEEPDEPMVGYVGRVVPWKGLKEIAKACKELGYKVAFMGKQDKVGYWQEIVKEGLDEVIDMNFYDCPDEERKNAYRNMTIYCGYSEDGLEEGPLGYLEAMASGVPVVTSLAGVANDIAEDGKNCLTVPFNNYEALRDTIKMLMTDEAMRSRLRKNGWETVKNMSDRKMAYEYSQLYYEIANQEDALVSAIIPFTPDRVMQVNELLVALEKQDYRNIEVVLANDSSEDLIEMYKTWRTTFDMPIKYVQTNNDSYGLAMARNMATVEAEGEYLLFLDSRLEPESDAIEVMVTTMNANEGKVWVFGDKGAGKKSFVENFSMVRRSDYINFGMCNERVLKYGGMSQEIRTRWSNNEGAFLYLPNAKAKQLMKASKNNKRRQDIIDMKFLLYKLYKNNAR
jgi:glycosyltransferase involved in cell wall biosynthesis